MRPSPQNVHVWIADYSSAKGGIQVFSNLFIRALGECLPQTRLTILSKNDSGTLLPVGTSPTDFYCTGRWILPLRTFAYSTIILTKALREQPDYIFCLHINFSPIALIAKRLFRTQYLSIGYGLDVLHIKSRVLRKALRAADRLLAISSYTRGCMVAKLKIQPGSVGLLPVTFDPDAFTLQPKPSYLLRRFGLQPDQPVVLTIARLASAERYKGYDQILRALSTVRQTVPRVRYILGGDGPDRPRIEQLIRELELEDVVTLAGYISEEELADFYSLCDVFAMPSKREGFGIVFLEALASGKPVIAGNQDGSVDALLNGELGVLIDPDDRAQLEEALVLTLTRQHPLTILQQPECLRARVIEAYGYRHFVSMLAEHLRQLGLPTRPPVDEKPATAIY